MSTTTTATPSSTNPQSPQQFVAGVRERVAKIVVGQDVVVALLRRLCSSPLVKLKDTQQSELQTDLKRVEAACFGAGTSVMSETDLRAIASKWLRSAT